VQRITAKALSLFDTMEELAERCGSCKEWWNQHSELHAALNLRPWEWPVYWNTKCDDAKATARYRALKAASDARKAK
jgi:hypothetical protein